MPDVATASAGPAAPTVGLRRLTATRYVTALREGGSVPAVVEADDGALYVAKFRAAAQGGRALAAEMIVGELARAAGLRVPELALIDIDAALGRSEPHQEIQELLIASAGLNLAMGYLAGAVGYDVAARRPVGGALASRDRRAGRLRRQRRSHRAQPEPALAGGRAVADRSRRGALLASRLGRHAERRAISAASAARPFARAGEHVLLPLADRAARRGRGAGRRADRRRDRARGGGWSPTRGWRGRAPTSCAPPTAPGCARGARRCPSIIDEADRVRAARV